MLQVGLDNIDMHITALSTQKTSTHDSQTPVLDTDQLSRAYRDYLLASVLTLEVFVPKRGDHPILSLYYGALSKGVQVSLQENLRFCDLQVVVDTTFNTVFKIGAKWTYFSEIRHISSTYSYPRIPIFAFSVVSNRMRQMRTGPNLRQCRRRHGAFTKETFFRHNF